MEWSTGYLLQKKGFWLTADLWGQIATANLLPSEQLILGGYNSIRGYEQSLVTVDDGVAASLELQTPSFSLLKFARCTQCNDKFYFLGFVDYGWGRNHKLIPGEKKGISLLGAGAGARYQLHNNLSARFDYAFPILSPPYSPKRTQSIFFGVVLSY
ncbi:MAG: BamA/TamA family outer membrane protein, partial [Chlamydiales bacterium]|nr:BamA/TamA family outer membrane protein [Chlamydiales bacterium]